MSVLLPNILRELAQRKQYDLPPEGRCVVAYPVGVQLFLRMFYFGLGNELWKEKKGHPRSGILAELFPQNVLFDGTGWTGGTEYQKGPLIFVILRYIKHYTHLNLNI